MAHRRMCPCPHRHEGAHHSQILDLLAEDDRLNVYAGELEVRPPGAPTTGVVWVVLGRWLLLGDQPRPIAARRDPFRRPFAPAAGLSIRIPVTPASSTTCAPRVR